MLWFGSERSEAEMFSCCSQKGYLLPEARDFPALTNFLSPDFKKSGITEIWCLVRVHVEVQVAAPVKDGLQEDR